MIAKSNSKKKMVTSDVIHVRGLSARRVGPIEAVRDEEVVGQHAHGWDVVGRVGVQADAGGEATA